MDKTLLIIRHAKSSWDITVGSDFDRTLNDRGKRDAPAMAKRLQRKGIIIDKFICSPAKRAKKTAEFFCEEYSMPAASIDFIDKLYLAPSNVFFEVVEALDNSYNTVALFSHNPGITEFVNLLLDDVRISNMPTCGIFAIKVTTENWHEFTTAPKSFMFFDYPKNE